MKHTRQRPAAPLQPGQPDVPLAVGLPLFFTSNEIPAPGETATHGLRHLQLDGHWLPYRLRRSSRRSIGFVINDDGLLVAAPLWLAQTDVEAAIRHKQGWIVAKLGEWHTRRAQRPTPRMLAGADGLSLPYLGNDITLRLEVGAFGTHWRTTDDAVTDCMTDPPGAATFDNAPVIAARHAPLPDGKAAAPLRELVVPLPPDAAPIRVRKAVASWLQDEARRIFAERLDHYAALLGTPYRKLVLSSARTRWGSCAADGTVRLNWRLIHLPRHLIDYVVAHELAHLKEMNHSPRFWAVVASLYPDYLSARKALRQHPPEHLPAC